MAVNLKKRLVPVIVIVIFHIEFAHKAYCAFTLVTDNKII